ncbi:hypothetical protein [Gaetbulibacter jejuensis]|uniref:Glycosyltransferase family 1 protein n=1 Tax=Gaetbulibacter jejuensis TaxID=584607 RepID=A0ABN1JW49_9FLAO
MKKLFKCVIHYFQSPHLAQVYDGFEKLKKQGLVDLSYIKVDGDEAKPILKVVLDDKYTVIYDLIDGLHWYGSTKEEKLNHFKTTTEADYYFKRSYTDQLKQFSPEHCSVYPLGLNYPLNTEGKYKFLKGLVVNSYLFKYLKPNYRRYPSELFESAPKLHKNNYIVFFAQLWNPDDVENEISKKEREQINQVRIAIIRACKSEFGDLFRGGIMTTSFSKTQCPDILASKEETDKLNYLRVVKESNICISTTGLHGSIGWQMGEYVAASKVIVSMPLNYDLPGDFIKGKNYLEFRDIEELISQIKLLLNNKELQFNMMNENFKYYNTYLKPDVLVLNTLMKVYNGKK